MRLPYSCTGIPLNNALDILYAILGDLKFKNEMMLKSQREVDM